MRGNEDVDLVVLDRAAGVLRNECAVALDINAAAERDDGRVNRNRAALGRCCAGCRLADAECAVADLTRAVERQLVAAERGRVRLDGVRCEILGRIADRTSRNRRRDKGRRLFRFFLGLLFRLSIGLGLRRRLCIRLSLGRCGCLGLRRRIRLCTGICLRCGRYLVRGEYRSDRSIQTGREYRNRLLQCRSVRRSDCTDDRDRREQLCSELSQRNRHLCYTPDFR